MRKPLESELQKIKLALELGGQTTTIKRTASVSKQSEETRLLRKDSGTFIAKSGIQRTVVLENNRRKVGLKTGAVVRIYCDSHNFDKQTLGEYIVFLIDRYQEAYGVPEEAGDSVAAS
jgi:hypothetical protein